MFIIYVNIFNCEFNLQSAMDLVLRNCKVSFFLSLSLFSSIMPFILSLLIFHKKAMKSGKQDNIITINEFHLKLKWLNADKKLWQ